MGGFFGAVSANDCIQDVFFGTDYHSHLGTRRGGMTSFSVPQSLDSKGISTALKILRFVLNLRKMWKICGERCVSAV